MRVWLIRHSNAVEADRFDGPDVKRPLTKAGKARARRFFRTLARQNTPPDAVVSSRAVRARETAALFCEAFKLRPARLESALNPDQPMREVVRAVRRRRPGCQFLVLIGHEPALSLAVRHLTAAGRLEMKLRKCGLVELEIPSRGRPVLTALLAPR